MSDSGRVPAGTEAPGTVIGGYVIERLLGAGGMGAVYAARHPRLPRVDAVKVLPTAFAGDPAYRTRFEREADMAGRLDHPNIVPVYDRGDDNGKLWMSMKLVPGRDAAALLAATPRGLPVGQVVTIVDAVAAALDYAHTMGLLHRDVKPGNILIDTTAASPRVLLGDFGIARAQQENSDLTTVGMVVGTLDYASPEQLSGDPVDGRSDEYSLAGTAVQLLTGTKPYGNSSGTAVIRDHLMAPPPAPSRIRPDLPPAIDGVIARAMAKTPQQRYPTCREFAQALRAAAATPAPYRPGAPSGGFPAPRAASVPTPRPTTPPPFPAAPAPAPTKRRGAMIATISVIAVAAVVLLSLIAIGVATGGDDPQAAPTTTSSAAPSTSVDPVSSTITLRDGFIDPCKLPAATITQLGLSALTDDPGQRETEGVRFACQGVDSKAAGGAVKFATFTSSASWNGGTPLAGSDKWRTFETANVNKEAPPYCVTAYKSTANGVLYIGMVKTPGRDCDRGAEIARAITPYLPL